MMFEQVIADAFDQLAPVYESERSEQTTTASMARLHAQYMGIRGQIGSDASRTEDVTTRVVLPPQLTPQTLARFLGAAECCWVLEDFHKIEPAEKKKLAQVMKVFMDTADEFPAVRITAIGAVDTARQVVEYDPEMRNRVAEIHVPLMNDEEITRLAEKGEELLNIRIPAAYVRASSGTPTDSHPFATTCV
jgi:hypothetical protein